MKRWLILVTLLFVSRPALAASDAASDDVRIVATGEPQVVAVMEQRLRTLLRDYPVEVHFSVASEFRPRDVFVTGEQAVLARIWLDVRASSRAVLYLVDATHERFLVRVVPLDAGYDEVAHESLGTIVQSSVEALLAGASVGVTRQAAEEQVQAILPNAAPAASTEPQVVQRAQPAEAQPSRRPRGEASSIGLGLGYRAQLLTRDPLVLHGPELNIGFGSRQRQWAVSGALALGYRVPVSFRADGVGAGLEGAGLRAAGGLRAAVSESSALLVLLTAGLDWLHVTPEVNTSSERARADFELFQPVVGLSLAWQLSFARAFAGWLALGVERDLLGHHFDVQAEQERRTVLEPWPVLPVMSVGVRWWP